MAEVIVMGMRIGDAESCSAALGDRTENYGVLYHSVQLDDDFAKIFQADPNHDSHDIALTIEGELFLSIAGHAKPMRGFNGQQSLSRFVQLAEQRARAQANRPTSEEIGEMADRILVGKPLYPRPNEAS